MVYVSFYLENASSHSSTHPSSHSPLHFSEPQPRQVIAIPITGTLIGWEVGSFSLPHGRLVHGVKLTYDDPIIGPATHVVELPSSASQIQVKTILHEAA